MYVQDIKSPGINITAAIPEDEAYNFQKMCSLYATTKSLAKLIDEYTSKLSLLQSANEVNSSNIESTSINARSESPRSSTSFSPLPILGKLIPECIDFRVVYDTILERYALSLMETIRDTSNHERHKTEIISILTENLKNIDSTLDLIPFGSNQYNLNETGSNLNLFIFTSRFLWQMMHNTYSRIKLLFCLLDKSNVAECLQKFENHLKSTNIHNHFKDVDKVNENRTLKQQISMVHLKSNIRCLLLFDNDESITKSTEIIQHFNERVPMCKNNHIFLSIFNMYFWNSINLTLN